MQEYEPMRRGITTNRNKLVIGPSGSGKSTFLRCINLLETPSDAVSLPQPEPFE